MKHCGDDHRVPQVKAPIMNTPGFRKALEEIREDLWVLSPNHPAFALSIHPKEFGRFPVWRCDCVLDASSRRQDFPGVVKMKSPDDLPQHAVEALMVN